MSGYEPVIDVKEVVEQIRARVTERYGQEDLREFADIAIDEALRAAQPHYDKGEARASGVTVGVSPFVDFYRDLPGNKAVVLVKRVARKLIRGTVQPITEHQTAFNQSVVEATDKLSWLCMQQQADIEQLKAQNQANTDLLRNQIMETEALKREVSEFKKILERY